MRKLLILLLCLPFFAEAQRLQYDNTYGREFNRLLMDSLFAPPSDTFRVPSALQSYPWVARKGTSLYGWNTSTFIWESIGGGGEVTTDNGISKATSTVILGGELDRYTPLILNGFPLGIRHDGVNNANQSDSNTIRLFNTSTAATTTDSLVSPGILFSTQGRGAFSGGSQNVRFRIDAIGQAGTTTANAQFRLRSSINNAAYGTIFRITAGGIILDNLNLNGHQIGQAGAGTSSIRFGTDALNFNNNSSVTGGFNTAIGYQTLRVNTTGYQNTALGYQSLLSNITGRDNVAVGVNALSSNDSAYNTAVGNFALYSNTQGEQNTAVGFNALFANTVAIKNTAVGAGSMELTTTGGFNTGLGHDAMLQNTTGTDNVGIGWLGWSQNRTGSYNIGIGNSSGRSITNGRNNIFIGHEAGYLGTQEDTVNNNIVLGDFVTTTRSNQMHLGNDSIQFVRVKGIPSGVGTKSLRYNPSTGDVTYADTSAGGGSSITAGYGLSGTTTFILDTTIAVNKANQQIIAGNKTFTGTTTWSSPNNSFRRTFSIDNSGNAIVDQNVDYIWRRGGGNIMNWAASQITIQSGVSLNVDANTFVVNQSTNRVGVLTTGPTSSLYTAGSFGGAYVAKTGAYTATESDYIIECTSGTFTVTLPTAASISGRVYHIVNSGAGTITIGTTSSQTFVNVAATPTTLTLATVGKFSVASNGANWMVL